MTNIPYDFMNHAEVSARYNPPCVVVRVVAVPVAHRAEVRTALGVVSPDSNRPVPETPHIHMEEWFYPGQVGAIPHEALRERVGHEMDRLHAWQQKQTALREKYGDWEYGMARSNKA